MRTRTQQLLAVTLVAAAAVAAAVYGPRPARADGGKKVKLFNGKNFDGWYTYINGDGKNNDPDKVFTIEDGGVIHASGKKYGYVGTENEYENYKLSVEFKWGQNKYYKDPNTPRDAGVLYYCVGPDKVWMKSLEFQIQEHDCGDMYLTGGEGGPPALTVKTRQADGSREFMWDPNGVPKTFNGGHVVKGLDNEKPNGQWNTAVVIARGPHIEHWINGKLNLVGDDASLTKGRINIQSEGAEIYYRNITLEHLK